VLLVGHSVVVYIQLDVAAAVVFAPVAAVFDAAAAAAAAAAEMDVCAVVGECVHVAQAGAYAEVSGKSVRNRSVRWKCFTHAHSFEVIFQA
jgi:hypothetical protein